MSAVPNHKNTPFQWFLEAWKKSFVFRGRAGRQEYWFFALFNLIVLVGICLVEINLGITDGKQLGLVSGLYSVATILPYISVTVRRLHDNDQSGWWLLAYFIPLLGGIILLFFAVLPGKPGDNQYGRNPN